MNEIILNSNACDRLLSTLERDQVVPCPDVAHWVIVARQSAGKTSAVCLLARLQPREGL